MSLQINPVLCRAGTMNNYAYILVDTQNAVSAVVDASEADPVIKKCQELNVRPSFILSTHHHFDHVGGNNAVKEKYNARIVVPEAEKENFEQYDFTVSQGDVLEIGKTQMHALSAPGHTRGHVLYYAPEEKVLFTGDVLFNLCIGGLFEGTPEQMWESLQKIKMLPDDVSFYPGHEYTAHCLAQAAAANNSQPMQLYTKIVTDRLRQKMPAAPIKLGLEKQCNPYLLIGDEKEFENLF